MKFLIVEQDLRISGTSQGIISRSFIGKLRLSYPDSIIDVVYLKSNKNEDQLNLLPINSIEIHFLDIKIPFYTKFLNRFYWRFFHVSLNENYIHNQYAAIISKIDYSIYDHIFIRSAGTEHEVIMATHNLPILKNAIVNFHDPFPLAWYPGKKTIVSKLDLFRLKKTIEIVNQAKSCSSSAHYMSHDLQVLYASNKKIQTLPHQFCPLVFDFSDKSQMRIKKKKIAISYHGALMFGRNIQNVLLAYDEILKENSKYVEISEFILRVKGDGVADLKTKYANHNNIEIFGTQDFSNSSNEQITETDIVIILENGPLYSNILPGKVPFIAHYQKAVLCISPEKSELRNIVIDNKYIASMDNILEIKLKQLIDDVASSNEPHFPFGDFFSDQNFKLSLDKIIN